jgi:hypothetical protein
MLPRAKPPTQDWSTILAKRKDKSGKEVTVIVGRRVCQMGPDEATNCPSLPQPGEFAQRAAKDLDAKRRALQDVADDRDRRQDEVTRNLKAAVPDDIQVPEMRTLKDKSRAFTDLKRESTRRGLPNVSRTSDDYKRQYDAIEKDAQQKIARAKQDVRAAERRLDEVQRRDPDQLALQRAAVAEAERETARRLDAMITQQVIRDAFRQ